MTPFEHDYTFLCRVWALYMHLLERRPVPARFAEWCEP